ncbi:MULTISPECIES: hypothetical protein [unclassified Rhizobium]|uniref:hypothetical protein n=1 Tax=unclassified Rhizobium TaxID=2613769 RepID=UPI000A487C8B|nr:MULTISPECIES: hypothetical protein [unclassified Rhizobium]TCM55685.1 hypothetical protein C8J36_10349 [Rhizobium sp. PP-F2F-G48]
MADVIRLQDRQHRGGRKMTPDGARQDATILLFTGIRYERMDGAPATTGPHPKASAVKPLNGSTHKH